MGRLQTDLSKSVLKMHKKMFDMYRYVTDDQQCIRFLCIGEEADTVTPRKPFFWGQKWEKDYFIVAVLVLIVILTSWSIKVENNIMLCNHGVVFITSYESWHMAEVQAGL